MSEKDPLGVQPAPIRGGKPDWDSARVKHAEAAIDLIWVKHQPQEDILLRLRTYMESKKGIRGRPLGGRRLSQFFQAGKSAIAYRLRAVLAAERAAASLPPNEHQVMIITITRRMTLKQFYQAILAVLEDDFHLIERLGPDERGREKRRRERTSAELLQAMLADWVLRLGVELLVVDEVQRLDRNSADAEDVTGELQTFCDRGIVPVVLIGNEKSKPFMEKNRELAARLGTPFELKPLDMTDDAQGSMFVEFCRDFDRQLVATRCTILPSGLDQPAVLLGLHQASSGHVGRVARILQEALKHAAARGAPTIEPHDLSRAVREYAIPLGWIEKDPFSRKAPAS